jgi:CRISPR/Cas system-associated protein Csm6
MTIARIASRRPSCKTKRYDNLYQIILYSENEHSFQVQVLVGFCENYLTEIIPNIVGKEKDYRAMVFGELFNAIVELNPDLNKVIKPIKGEARTYKVDFISQTSPYKETKRKWGR